MHIGIVFHKNPLVSPTGIDLVRLRALTRGLIEKGFDAEIVAPIQDPAMSNGVIPVRPLSVLDEAGRFDLVKTCYHQSIKLLGRYEGPVVSRIVRVVDRELPERDEPFRKELLSCQEAIRDRASTLVLNNEENLVRWRSLYGSDPPIVLVPTGCRKEIPPCGNSPFNTSKPVILFLGSVAAPRMVRMLNEAARRLHGLAEIHLVGLNKACLYGGDADCLLDPGITNHGELPEDLVWDYVRYASAGLALASGPHPFDNDMSKIFTYLRGGLAVLSEEFIVNNDLVRITGFGEIFRYDDPDDLVEKAARLFRHPLSNRQENVMNFMADRHCWDRRVETYVDLFSSILK